MRYARVRIKDTVEIKLDSCEANLLVVKSFPRTRGVDPMYGVAINGTAAFPLSLIHI